MPKDRKPISEHIFSTDLGCEDDEDEIYCKEKIRSKTDSSVKR